MKTKYALILFTMIIPALYAKADCSYAVNAVANGIAQTCAGSQVKSIKRASWLGQEGYYITLDKDCLGGLVGYRIKMSARSCALIEASADLGE
jgi:hypothetical protein